jgi:predicted Zn-dependent peptidase
MGLESTSNQIMWMGESLLGYGQILDPSEIERRVLAVTPEDVRQTACYCLNRARLGLAVVGPLKDEEKIRGWLT